MFDLWVPKGNQAPVKTSNRWAALAEEDNDKEGDSMGFVGLDDLF